MKEEDRRVACEALQDIEADLLFGYIEAYRAGRTDEALELLFTLERLVDLMGKICKQYR